MKKSLWGLVIVLLFFICVMPVRAVTTDTEGPTISKLKLVDAQESYKPGDKIYFTDDIKDEISGVNSVVFWSYRIQNPLDEKLDNNVDFKLDAMQVFHDENGSYSYIPCNYRAGAYFITRIDLTDNNDNKSYYYTADYVKYEREHYEALKSGVYGVTTLYETFDEYLDGLTRGFKPLTSNISVRYTVSGVAEDVEAPVLDAYSLDKETVNVGESVTISLKITDDSDYLNVWVGLSNGNTITTKTNSLSGPVNVTYTPLKNTQSGTVKVISVILEDNYGNLSYYYTPESINSDSGSYYKYNSKYQAALDHPLTFEVVNNGDLDDTEAPVLKSVTLSKTEVPAPSIIKITAEVTDNKKLGEETVVAFKHDTKRYTATLKLTGENTYTGELEIDQYAELGEYELTEVFIGDAIGNDRYYFKYDDKYKTDDLTLDVKFNVTSKFTPDVVTSTMSTDMLDKIKNAKDDATIGIDATGSSTIRAEVFEAIKGTNKTIYVEANGIEWVFNGKDIKEPKDIVTTLGVYYDYDYKDESLNELLDKALVLEFADNGELPGVATVRIKLDYAFRDYVGDKVYVYHYVDGDRVFSEITGEAVGQNDNGWFEFKISHNSTYVLSTSKPAEKYIKEDKEMVKLNEEFVVTKPKKNNDKLAIIIGCAIGLIALVVILFCIFRKRKKVTSK